MTVSDTQQGTEQPAHKAVEPFLHATTLQELDATFDKQLDLQVDSITIVTDNRHRVTFITEYDVFPLYVTWSLILLERAYEQEVA